MAATAAFWSRPILRYLCAGALAALAAGLSPHPAWLQHPLYFPTVFVAVFSRRSGAERRALLRRMWRRGPRISARFALCNDTSADNLTMDLLHENATFGDLLLLNCKEGYGDGLLTKKTLAAMEAYMQDFRHMEIYGKADDDTYLAWSRLYPAIARAFAEAPQALYLGSMGDGPTKSVDRDPSSPFYEPLSNYPNCSYARFAGGQAYFLSRELVAQALHQSVYRGRMLWNEDAAVGLWMQRLVQLGAANVSFVKIKNAGNCWPTAEGWQKELGWFYEGQLRRYMGVLTHHHLSAEAIACLHGVEAAHDLNASIDGCFSEADREWVPCEWDHRAGPFGQKGCGSPAPAQAPEAAPARGPARRRGSVLRSAARF